MKLLSITKSTNPKKKWMAVFDNNGRSRTTHFGAQGMDDYTLTKNQEQRDRYLKRHHAREDWTDPTTAGALSRWILWNKPSLQDSIADYKKRFKL